MTLHRPIAEALRIRPVLEAPEKVATARKRRSKVAPLPDGQWPLQVADKAVQLRSLGYSCAEISREIGKTRNAVAGFLWRRNIECPKD